MHGAAALALANTEKEAPGRVVLGSLQPGEKDEGCEVGLTGQLRQLPSGAAQQQLGEEGGEGPKAPLPAHSPSRTFSSLWPTYMLMSSGPFTLSNRMGE